jgi:hypothetical protein
MLHRTKKSNKNGQSSNQQRFEQNGLLNHKWQFSKCTAQPQKGFENYRNNTTRRSGTFPT